MVIFNPSRASQESQDRKTHGFQFSDHEELFRSFFKRANI